MVACGNGEDRAAAKDQAASACDAYIKILEETQTGDLTPAAAAIRVKAARDQAELAADADSSWDPLVSALSRMLIIMSSGDTTHFQDAGQALQDACSDAYS